MPLLKLTNTVSQVVCMHTALEAWPVEATAQKNTYITNSTQKDEQGGTTRFCVRL